MKVKELREAIAGIGKSQVGPTGLHLVEGLAELDRLFEGHDEETVDDFLAAMRRAPPTLTHVESSVVDEYVARLNDVGHSEDRFGPLFQSLSSDPRVLKGEANAIQHGYIGGRREWPTKREALAAIQKWFHSRRFEEAILDDIKKTTPW